MKDALELVKLLWPVLGIVVILGIVIIITRDKKQK